LYSRRFSSPSHRDETRFGEAAGIVGIFDGLGRNDDFSGMSLDDMTLEGSKGFRENLELDAFKVAANTDLQRFRT